MNLHEVELHAQVQLLTLYRRQRKFDKSYQMTYRTSFLLYGEFYGTDGYRVLTKASSQQNFSRKSLQRPPTRLQRPTELGTAAVATEAATEPEIAVVQTTTVETEAYRSLQRATGDFRLLEGPLM